MYTIKLTLKPYLAEYLQKHYPAREPGLVKFPPSSRLYEMVYDSLRKRPTGEKEEGNVEVILPDPKRKGGVRVTSRTNFISRQAKGRIASAVYRMYWREFHLFMAKRVHFKGDRILDAVLLWISVNGLTQSNEDMLLKNYQRMQQQVKKERIDIHFSAKKT